MRARREEEEERSILCVMEGQLTTYDKLLIACRRRAFDVSFFFRMPQMVLTQCDFCAVLWV